MNRSDRLCIGKAREPRGKTQHSPEKEGPPLAVLDESQIPTDKLDPLRPDQLANWSLGTAVLSVFMPYVWILLGLAGLALSIRAHYLLFAGLSDRRRFRGGVRATAGGILSAVALAWRSSDFLVTDLMAV